MFKYFIFIFPNIFENSERERFSEIEKILKNKKTLIWTHQFAPCARNSIGKKLYDTGMKFNNYNLYVNGMDFSKDRTAISESIRQTQVVNPLIKMMEDRESRTVL